MYVFSLTCGPGLHMLHQVNVITGTTEYNCVASWAEGSTYYLVVEKNDLSLSIDEVYDCFTYTQAKSEDHEYLLRHNDSAVCGSIDNHFDVTYKVYPVPQGRC